MADIIPFRAIRPARDKAHLVATRSYVSYSPNNLRRKLAENPYSFVHVINPEYSMHLRPIRGAQRFPLVREKYLEFLDEGILQRDKNPAFYLYRQIQPHDSFVGIIGGISVEDYDNGTIKKHEATLTRREELFKHYLDVCNFNAEPVLLTYPDDSELESLIEQVEETMPEFDFSTTDKIRHQLWVIEDPETLAVIHSRFEPMKHIYIADGHHRSASSSLLSKGRRDANTGHTGEEMYNYLMACMIPESQLSIYDYNRVIKDLNGHTPDEFKSWLEKDFDISPLPSAAAPDGLHAFSMYLDGKWYSLRLKALPDSDSPVDHLDAQILYERVLRPYLEILDPKTDARIAFVSGKEGMTGLQQFADKKKMKLAFGLHPVSTAQLKEVSDAEQIMPPKTTWIEPKLRSGLTIFSFD